MPNNQYNFLRNTHAAARRFKRHVVQYAMETSAYHYKLESMAPYVLSDDLRDMPDIEWRIARRDTN